jgi:DNA primase
MDDVQLIYSRLAGRNFGRELFRGLGKHRDDGQGNYKTDCPFCGGNDFSFHKAEPVWQCWNCGESGDWIDFLRAHQGMTFLEALKRLAEQANYELDAGGSTDRASRAERNVLEDAHDYFQEALQGADGQGVRAYLQQRGFGPQEALDVGFGAYPSREALMAELEQQGHQRQAIDEAGLTTTGFGQSHRLMIPVRDAVGRLKGFIGRLIDEQPDASGQYGRKYINQKGLQPSQLLFGLHEARKQDEAILTEGPLDALRLQAEGLPAVALLGSGQCKPVHAKLLESAGIEEVVLMLDADEAGRAGTVNAIKALWEVEQRVYVAELPEGHDPDSYLDEHGLEALQEQLDEALPAERWLVQYICSQHDLDADRGLDQAIEQAGRAHLQAPSPMARKRFTEELEQETGESKDVLKQHWSRLKQERQREQKADRLERESRQIQRLAQEGNLEKAESKLEGLQGKLDEGRGLSLPEPYLPSEALQEISGAPEGLKTGLDALDDRLTLASGGLNVVAARTSHGKTTVQLQLMRNILEQYPDHRVYFLSYEEPRDTLFMKTIMGLAGIPLDEQKNHQAYRDVLARWETDRQGLEQEYGPKPLQAIQEAIETYSRWMERGRLTMTDRAYNSQQLASLLELIGQQDGPAVVLLDYIQKVQVADGRYNARYMEVQQVAKSILSKAIRHHLTVITGAQFNREVDSFGAVQANRLRESGDLEQDASVVLGLWNDVAAGQEEEHQPGKPILLRMKCLKQRNGAVGWDETVFMEPEVGRVADKRNAGQRSMM